MANGTFGVNTTQPTQGVFIMKKFIAALFASFMLLGLLGFVSSASAEPGPNGNNDKGLCTAYFNGQKNGHNKDGKDSPAPFKALEDAADEEDDNEDANQPGGSLETAADVFEFCQGMIGGNPSNGRFDCSGNDEDGYTCEDGGGPGADGKGKNA